MLTLLLFGKTNKKHKILQFADDILTDICDPAVSAPAVMTTQEDYGSCSRYHINQTKYQATILKGQLSMSLKDSFKFRISNQGFKYLEVFLTPQPLQLLKTNYGRGVAWHSDQCKCPTHGGLSPRYSFHELESCFQQPLTRLIPPLYTTNPQNKGHYGHNTLEKKQWEMNGRTQNRPHKMGHCTPINCRKNGTIRTNILPRLLFLFQSLTIKIPAFIFSILNKWLSKCI